MRSLIIVVLLSGLLSEIYSRPSPQPEERNDSDLEEGDYENEPAADDNVQEEEEDSMSYEPAELTRRVEMGRTRQYADVNDALYSQQRSADIPANTDSEKFSGYKPDRNRDARNEKFYDSSDESQPATSLRQANRYIESNDVDANKLMRVQNNVFRNNQIDKRTNEAQSSNEESDLLFENKREQLSTVNKNEYNNDGASDSSERSQYFKQYYNTMQADKALSDDKDMKNCRLNQNRDRRQVQELNQKETSLTNLTDSGSGKESLQKSDNEDEEAAIKRHIKKLSGEELEDLLNSLSDEKRVLLQKIMDSDINIEDNINKREITKKAGALEENNFIEGGPSDSSKIQGGSSSFEGNTESSVAQNSETTEISKQSEGPTDINDISSTKSAVTNGFENKGELSSCNPDLDAVADTKNEVEMVASDKVTSKTDTKREIHLDDSMDIDMSFDDSKMLDNDFDQRNSQSLSNDQDCFYSQNEDLTQLIEDESQLHTNNGNSLYKRQAFMENEIDLPDSVKSLEESFPNSDTYDESGPYSGPLVRVKRTNPVRTVKKRAAGLLPDANVAFVPYRAENDDEDNDEGNEFEDDAFYDRTSNLENSNIKNAEQPSDNVEFSRKSKRPNVNVKTNQYMSSKDESMESDSMSLGSDTDSVLSGVEGVDDNLMFSSGGRNRRDVESESNKITEEKPNRPLLSTALENEIFKGSPQNNVNVPNYQENDSFGPLPRNYDGDLNRYKRIRRVKQSHAGQ